MAKGILKVFMILLSVTIQLCIKLFEGLIWLLEQALRIIEEKTLYRKEETE